MSNPALQPAAGIWNDTAPDCLPPLDARALCRNVHNGRLFVAARIGTEQSWRWKVADGDFRQPDFVDQWAAIKLRGVSVATKPS